LKIRKHRLLRQRLSPSKQAPNSGRDVRRSRGRRHQEPEAEAQVRQRVRRQELVDRLRRGQPDRLRTVSADRRRYRKKARPFQR
jgi:hypothetical protein